MVYLVLACRASFDWNLKGAGEGGGRCGCGAGGARVHPQHFQNVVGTGSFFLAALLPLLPAKQRPTHANDWMSTDAEVACPDPNCPTRFRITRTGKRGFSHAATTAVPLDKKS